MQVYSLYPLSGEGVQSDPLQVLGYAIIRRPITAATVETGHCVRTGISEASEHLTNLICIKRLYNCIKRLYDYMQRMYNYI